MVQEVTHVTVYTYRCLIGPIQDYWVGIFQRVTRCHISDGLRTLIEWGGTANRTKIRARP